MRFIEMMPFARRDRVPAGRWSRRSRSGAHRVAALGPLEPVNGGQLDGEARVYRLPGANRARWASSPPSRTPFCASCTPRPPDRRRRAAHVPAARVRGGPAHPAAAGAPAWKTCARLILDGVWYKPWGHGLAEGMIP